MGNKQSSKNPSSSRQDLVKGYVRIYALKDSQIFKSMPKGIILLIINYSKPLKFVWDIKYNGANAIFSENNERVEFTHWGSVIGNRIISSKEYKKYSYSVKVNYGNWITFGYIYPPISKAIKIWSTPFCYKGKDKKGKGSDPNMAFAIQTSSKDGILRASSNQKNIITRYGGKYGHKGNKLTKTDKYLERFDIVKCEIDFINKTASFYINDDCLGVVFEHVGDEVIPAIASSNAEGDFSLVNFDCQL